MTPQEQIAYLRNVPRGRLIRSTDPDLLAVCDLAERAEQWHELMIEARAERDAERAARDALLLHDSEITLDRDKWRERALLTDDEAEAVADEVWHGSSSATVRVVLRRLLPDEPVGHRLTAFTKFTDSRGEFRCSCGWAITNAPDAAVRAWAAHAGIGGTE